MTERNTPHFTDQDRTLLIKLEERIINLKDSISEQRGAIEELNRRIDYEREQVRSNFVTKLEFQPVSRAVYAAIGFILTAFLGAVITLIIKGH